MTYITKMNRLLLTITLLLALAITAHAQSDALIYKSVQDFYNNKYMTASVYLIQRDNGDDEWIGANIYKFKAVKNRHLTVGIKESCFALQYHDSLFLNCIDLLHVNGYANVLMRAGPYLFFNTIASNVREHRKYIPKGPNDNAAAAMIAGGLIGGAVVGALSSPVADHIRVNYLYNMDTGKTDVMTPELLAGMLSKRTDLLQLYKNSGMPDDDGSYYWYLARLFGIEK